MKKTLVGLGLLWAATSAAAKDKDEVNFAKSMTASELAEQFFGPSKAPQTRQAVIKVGRIGVSAKTKLNCGKIDAVASVEGELKNIEGQLKATSKQIEAMFLNPSGLAMAAVCYYKPSVCSYVRHTSLMFGENLNLAFNACRSIDHFIDGEADKGMRTLQAEGIQRCIMDRSRGGAISTDDIRDCQSKDGQMRNLLQPFNTQYASSKQKVLESLVTVVGEKSEYSLMAQVLGEVEVYQNGYWVKMFPQDLMSPKALTQNLIAAGEQDSCDTAKLEAILKGSEPLGSEPLAKVVREVMKEKLQLSVVKDLNSLPDKDRKMVCTAMGEGIAEIATKRLTARHKAIMASALTNDALPDDLRVFYEKRSDQTLAAVVEKIEAEGITPLGVTLERLQKLAFAYREKNRSEASGVSSMKIFNEKKDAAKSCEDEFSCGN